MFECANMDETDAQTINEINKTCEASSVNAFFDRHTYNNFNTNGTCSYLDMCMPNRFILYEELTNYKKCG